MAVIRRVHTFAGNPNHPTLVNGVGTYVSAEGWPSFNTLLNRTLSPAERIVAVQREGETWYVFTESFGLGPTTKGVP